MKSKKGIIALGLILGFILFVAAPWGMGVSWKGLGRVQGLHDAMSSGFEYYGRVIDQHGNPVAGASVTARWAYFPFIPNGDFGPNYKNLHLTTDSDGRFSIQKDDGMSIVINTIEKGGYEIKGHAAYMFSDGGYKMLQSFSDPENPVIFHAWKKAEAEPLYYGEFKCKKGTLPFN